MYTLIFALLSFFFQKKKEEKTNFSSFIFLLFLEFPALPKVGRKLTFFLPLLLVFVPFFALLEQKYPSFF
jgi:ABC-type Na+ efflux pump permease subunit